MQKKECTAKLEERLKGAWKRWGMNMEELEISSVKKINFVLTPKQSLLNGSKDENKV